MHYSLRKDLGTNFDSTESLIHAVEHTAQSQPERLALNWLDSRGRVQEKITYGDLIIEVDDLACQIVSQGATPGNRVVLLFQPGLHFIKTFLACLKLDSIPVPLKAPANREQMAGTINIIRDCQPILICSNQLAPDFYSEDIPWLTLSFGGDKAFLSPIESEDPNLNQKEVAFIQYTSGATGSPKGVVVTHSNLNHNHSILRTFHARLRKPKDYTFFSWLPHFHDMGLIGVHLLQLRFGATGHYMSPRAFFSNPNGFLESISALGVNNFAVPNFALEWILKHYDGALIRFEHTRDDFCLGRASSSRNVNPFL